MFPSPTIDWDFPPWISIHVLASIYIYGGIYVLIYVLIYIYLSIYLYIYISIYIYIYIYISPHCPSPIMHTSPPFPPYPSAPSLPTSAIHKQSTPLPLDKNTRDHSEPADFYKNKYSNPVVVLGGCTLSGLLLPTSGAGGQFTCFISFCLHQCIFRKSISTHTSFNWLPEIKGNSNKYT